MSEKLESKQLLWQHIFKDDQLIIRLIKDHASACAKVSINPSLENADENAITIESSKWGSIKLKIWAATTLGDNFLSDAYTASAKLNDGEVEYRSFIKVSQPTLIYTIKQTKFIHYLFLHCFIYNLL